MKKLKVIAPLAVVLAVLVTMLTSCNDTATPTSMCAFVVNDGEDGHDSKIDHVAYPGDKIDSLDKDVFYFPCNGRNFVVNDGSVKDANGDVVGDRHTQTVAYTKEGNEVLISWKAFWTPNQTKDVLEKEFYPFCYKYDCYSTDADANDANYSDKGWNGMLGENFSPAGDTAIASNTQTILTDVGVSSHNRSEWDSLAEAASNAFADAIRPYTGVQDDLFCGSGNSGWEDPNKPGEGEFTCSNVRFVVESVEFKDSDLQKLADRKKKADEELLVNQAELDAAKKKYGDNAEYWLGLQDTMQLCTESTNCIITFGGNGATPSVSIPETATETK